ncbi:hypothetical protein ADK57_25905 [Streptomyces sp. MMG1533]|uniref:hypothetical protein n=1 Tax=Streptomyces sp. MMG1533 TaxID=1415546 RepID=UPI0006ADB2AA|nr:hypothetical protein [Streptomyces sp. MMG1533]KOU62070.1 hypothetical protein ADK57_25905 [Streptomyces sp. MMG1533]
MTPEQAAMVDFLRQQYADKLDIAQSMARAFTMSAGADLGLQPADAAQQARSRVHAAETRTRFLDETVVPYLGTAGPTGRIADIQLRLLADEHRGARGYDETWRP